MTTCNKCNEEVPAGKKFCANCGEKLIKESKSIEYEEYHLRKNKCTATMVFYVGVFVLGMGILTANFLMAVTEDDALLQVGIILPGFFILSIGGFWAMNSEYLLSQRLTKDFEESQRK